MKVTYLASLVPLSSLSARCTGQRREQPRLRVNGFAKVTDFKINLAPALLNGRIPCIANDLPRLYRCTSLLQHLSQMGSESVVLVTVIYDDHLAVPFHPLGIKNLSIVDDDHWRQWFGGYFNAVATNFSAKFLMLFWPEARHNLTLDWIW